MSESINRIIAALPREFFRALQENFDAAFVRADMLATKNFAKPEQVAMRGQHRHAFCEDALRSAATEAGINAISAHTEPAGARFSLVSHEGVNLIRSNIQAHCGTPRPSKFRSQFAAMNAWLRPVQDDLFETVVSPPNDQLCGMIIATINRRGDQSLPAFLGLGIPLPDLSGWLAFEPLHKVMARYQGFDSQQVAGHGPIITVIDKAMPKLKKKK